MKKELIVIVFVLLISVSFSIVSSQNEDKEGLGNVGDELKSGSEGLLSQEIEIPVYLKIPSRIVFGLKEDSKVDLQTFVIMLALWVFLLLVIHSILDITPFSGEWKSWVGAVLVTLLISLTGAVRSVSVFFFNLGNIFGILEKWSILKITFSIVLLVAIFFASSFLLRILKESMKVGKAVSEGMQAGAQL